MYKENDTICMILEDFTRVIVLKNHANNRALLKTFNKKSNENKLCSDYKTKTI